MVKVKKGLTPPPYGLCIPVEYSRVSDGDTPVFLTRMRMKIAIRRIGVDAPEIREEGGNEEAENLHNILANADEIRVHIPLASTGTDAQLDIFDILRALTFDRVPGHVYTEEGLVQ